MLSKVCLYVMNLSKVIIHGSTPPVLCSTDVGGCGCGCAALYAAGGCTAGVGAGVGAGIGAGVEGDEISKVFEFFH